MSYILPRIRQSALAALAVSLLVSRPLLPTALAQPPPAPTASEDADASKPPPRPAASEDIYEGQEAGTLSARNQFVKGVNLAKQEQWGDAYPPLLDAWKQKKHWQIALNLGRVEFELGKYRDAAEHFEIVLRAPELAQPADAPDPLAETRSLAVFWLANAKSKLGHIRVDASPRSARIIVDGAPAGDAPLSSPIHVDPGTHTIEVRFGGASERRRIAIESGKEVTVTLKVTLPDEKANTPSVELAKPLAKPFPTRWVLLGTGAALAFTSVSVGAVATWLAWNDGQIAAASHQGPEGRQAVAEAQYKSLALWAFLGAGVVGGATITYYLTTRHSTAPVQATAAVRPGGGSLVISGGF